MAENWCKAFGRYLKTLRGRRGLSLREVCSLSQAFTETVNKGYLSRCENGRQSVAFSKIIPLARIYCVPADVLLERLELDMELDRVGGPDTEGKSFAELTAAGIEATKHGYGWDAYGYLRDAIPLAARDEVIDRYSDRAEQVACAQMNCVTATTTQGRKRFPLHEFKYVESTGALGPRYHPIILERISVSYRSIGQLDQAIKYGARALAEAQESGEFNRLGVAYSNCAQLALASSKLDEAADSFRQAYEAFKKAGVTDECPRTLNNLAQVYFDLGRFRASRRTLLAAESIAASSNQHRAQALGRILMGEIDEIEHHDELAARRWKEAATIAKTLNDKVIRFKAEYLLFKQAHEQGNQPVARSLHRRLRRLAHWVPRTTPELASFRHIADQRSDPARN